MLFNSVEFLFFFPVVTALYFVLPHRVRWMLLLVASCVFYAAFIPSYLLVLGFTIVIDYAAGLLIARCQGRQRTMMLFVSIAANVGVLGFFKYYNFFVQNVEGVLHAIGIASPTLPGIQFVLPIGLSFHTFQAMSYTIEVYRGKQKPERHLGIYALYVMFYPQLVAGPIERPQNMLHQFREIHTFNGERFADGLRLMLWGLFKKVVIADRLAVFVNGVYRDPSAFDWVNLALAIVFFSVQIYCDFSGYSDIALGAARCMGFTLMTNFDRPYFATNIRAFWGRWHISLSTWFRDYVYIPLGGGRTTRAKVLRNIAIVFMVSGLWHGANWTFVVWGALHALFMIGYVLYRERVPAPLNAPLWRRAAGGVATFALVSLAWVFFRSDSINSAIAILSRLVTLQSNQPNYAELAGDVPFLRYVADPQIRMLFLGFSALLIMVLVFVERTTSVDMTSLRSRPVADTLLLIALLTGVVCLGIFDQSAFIYFQF